MTEYDLWKIFPRMPKKVMIGDPRRLPARGEAHSTKAKIFYGQESILAGCRELEVTNLAAGTTLQFVDADEVMKAMRSDEFRAGPPGRRSIWTTSCRPASPSASPRWTLRSG